MVGSFCVCMCQLVSFGGIVRFGSGWFGGVEFCHFQFGGCWFPGHWVLSSSPPNKAAPLITDTNVSVCVCSGDDHQ